MMKRLNAFLLRMGTKQRCLLSWFLPKNVMEILARIIRPPPTKDKKKEREEGVKEYRLEKKK